MLAFWRQFTLFGNIMNPTTVRQLISACFYGLFSLLCWGANGQTEALPGGPSTIPVSATDLGLIFLALAAMGYALYLRGRLAVSKPPPTGKPKEVQTALQDDLVRARAQLIRMEKLASLGALTAGIAHEIRNPLNFINNFAEIGHSLADELRDLLHEKSLIPESERQEVDDLLTDLAKNLDHIRSHGDRLENIVQSMLLHARSKGEERHQTDLNALVTEYVNLAYHGTRAREPEFNTALIYELDSQVGRLDLAPQEIGRVLINLLTNAFHATRLKMEPGYQPQVRVRTHKDVNGVQISIRDNGIGIPKALVEQVFKPFFTTKPLNEGTGLGLSICRDIIHKHYAGHLVIDSEEGQFTEVTLSLPFHPEAQDDYELNYPTPLIEHS